MSSLIKINELIESIGNAEKITKVSLSIISREVVEYIMIQADETKKASEDSSVANRLLEVLTPVNRKVCTLFFKHFLSFSFNDDTEFFGKKEKKSWSKKVLKCSEFLADPHNNIWSWAERNVVHEVKPYSPETVKKSLKSIVTKAHAAKIHDVDIIAGLIEAGISAQAILDCIKLAGAMPEAEKVAA